MNDVTIDTRPEFRLIVAGGRDFNDRELLAGELIKLASEELKDRAVSIVSGMARGADRLAWDFAKHYDITVYEFPANWTKYQKRAGYIRNVEMAEFSHGLLLFWDGISRGSKHMLDIAEAKGLNVRVVKY